MSPRLTLDRLPTPTDAQSRRFPGLDPDPHPYLRSTAHSLLSLDAGISFAVHRATGRSLPERSRLQDGVSVRKPAGVWSRVGPATAHAGSWFVVRACKSPDINYAIVSCHSA